MTLNLLPWRIAKAKNQLKQDFLCFIFLLGLGSALLEIGLGLLALYQKHFTEKTVIFQQKSLTQQSEFLTAVKTQEEFNLLKKQSASQKALQKEWKKYWGILKWISEQKPNEVQLYSINFHHKNWQITGYAQKIDALTTYQKNLQRKSLKVELKRWVPPSKSENSENFELELES